MRSQCADDRKDEVYELMRLWEGGKVVKRKAEGGKADGGRR